MKGLFVALRRDCRAALNGWKNALTSGFVAVHWRSMLCAAGRACMACCAVLLCGCGRQQAPMTLHWEMGANDVRPGVCEMYLTITNTSSAPITNEGWTLYFNYMSLHPLTMTADEQPLREGAIAGALLETEIQASYHSIVPTEAFAPLQLGESRTYCMRYRGSVIRQTSIPEGFFLVRDGGQPVSVACTYAPFTQREQMMRGIETWEKTPYAEGEYVYAYNQRPLTSTQREQVLPVLPQPKSVVYQDGVCDVAHAEVLTRTDVNMVHEGYVLRLTPDTICIEASNEAGVFYARQTLVQLSGQVPCAVITDYPDLPHRAVMLDIVRNYYPADSIKRVIDVMAQYKLNVLHLHLSDDEGWRLEIPGLPELTTTGARRGYTTTESECLLPMYCGGWDYNDPTSTANGYVTRAQYIDLLRYAAARQIRVIPEIDMPGHMRACKKAMHGLLTDSVLEARRYLSAQNYTDNVIAVSNPYAVEFVDKVISEIVKMHNEAGCPLSIFDIGGDEVPNGALTHEEHQAFIDQVLAILEQHHLQPAGWEEIGHFCAPETRAICYSWHNGEAKPLELAEAGYPVVLAAANHLYFDFAYCNHHEEKGLNWGGYTDEYRAFDWEPLQHPNIMGMSAQLWSEVIRSFAQVEWQLYPKMFGLVERAWNNRSDLTLGEYNALVYETCLPRLHAAGHNFHIQQPGIHAERTDDGTLRVAMNRVMQGGEIWYRVDDGEWQRYDGVFMLPDNTAVIKARIRYLDHESNTTWLWVAPTPTEE